MNPVDRDEPLVGARRLAALPSFSFLQEWQIGGRLGQDSEKKRERVGRAGIFCTFR